MSSLCVKSPARDFGDVRAISGFQSSLATVLAPSQTKCFKDVCRRVQLSTRTEKNQEFQDVAGLLQKSRQVPSLKFHIQETVLV